MKPLSNTSKGSQHFPRFVVEECLSSVHKELLQRLQESMFLDCQRRTCLDLNDTSMQHIILC